MAERGWKAKEIFPIVIHSQRWPELERCHLSPIASVERGNCCATACRSGHIILRCRFSHWLWSWGDLASRPEGDWIWVRYDLSDFDLEGVVEPCGLLMVLRPRLDSGANTASNTFCIKSADAASILTVRVRVSPRGRLEVKRDITIWYITFK